MSRSNKEERESLDDAQHLPLGTGLLDRAKKSLKGRKSKMDEALEAAETGIPVKKKLLDEY
jgi:hypothetical protein